MSAESSDSNLHLIETSAWIPVLRKRHPAGPGLRARITYLQGLGLAATTNIVVFELLRGARDVSNYQELATGLGTLPLLPIPAERWQEAARLGFELRVHHGLSFPSADLLIAAVAIAHDATLIHRDSDFDLIAKHTALRVESYTYLGYS